MKKLLLASVAAVTMLAFGCGEQKPKTQIDTTKPVAQVKTDAAKMDKAQLQKQADAYKAALTAQKAELEKFQKQLKEIPVTEMLGEKAKKLKNDIAAQSKTITAINERLQVYLDELKKKGTAQ
jgi:predicted  nucleic acid-binding Zn-ribbon protein